jgi:hypothetical protein
VTGVPAVGVVAGGTSRKLRHLRAHPRATVAMRAGWQWRRSRAMVTPAHLYGNS